METAQAKQRHILIVEDDKREVWQKNFQFMLGQRRQIPFTLVSSPEAARRVIEEGQLPVTDIITDGLDGRAFEVAELAQERGLPIRIVSGSNRILQEALDRNIPFMSKGEMNWDEL